MTIEVVAALLFFVFVGVPVLWVTVVLCYELLKLVVTVPAKRGGVADEVDGMYVRVDGQVRVDD